MPIFHPRSQITKFYVDCGLSETPRAKRPCPTGSDLIGPYCPRTTETESCHSSALAPCDTLSPVHTSNNVEATFDTVERIVGPLRVPISLPYIVTMSLFCTVSTIYRDIARKLPIWSYPISTWRSRWGWPRWNFADISAIRKLESLGYRRPMSLFLWS